MWSPSDNLLAQYLAGDCTDAEVGAIERWLDEHPANRARLNDLRTISETLWPPAAPDVDAMWAGVRRTMGADRARAARFGRMFRAERRAWWRAPLAAAAAALLLLGGSFLLVQTSSHPAGDAAPQPMREYATPRGQRATFQLSDGTRLVLAAESRLRVPADYGRGLRKVYLEGEALFDVVHDSTRRFLVHAKDAVAEDLGTRFDVRAYPEDSVVAVAVAEGAVALGRADTATDATGRPGEEPQGIVLREGELGTLGADGRVTTATGSALSAYLLWADGRLSFVETPMPDVLRTLGRWYDLEFRIEGEVLASRVLTAELAAQSAEELMRALGVALDASVSRSGKVVTLRPKA